MVFEEGFLYGVSRNILDLKIVPWGSRQTCFTVPGSKVNIFLSICLYVFLQLKLTAHKLVTVQKHILLHVLMMATQFLEKKLIFRPLKSYLSNHTKVSGQMKK